MSVEAYRGLREEILEGTTAVNNAVHRTDTFGLPDKIKALKASNTIEATPQRMREKHTTAEEPVTARIRKQFEAAQVAELSNQSQATPDTEATPPTHEVENSDSNQEMKFGDRIALQRQKKDDPENML